MRVRRHGSRTLGRLRSSRAGRFATLGAFSTATARAATFAVADECAGTLTEVTRGSVVVDHLRRHHGVAVRAGYDYLARDSGASSPVTRLDS